MKLTFRWYGESDPIKLDYIRQIPNMYSVVTAVYDVPVGNVWSNESIEKLVRQAGRHGLKTEVIESVPVHEDIKLGRPTRDTYIENYKENIRRLAKAGVKCICYNFMPVFDWTRTEQDKEAVDGSTRSGARLVKATVPLAEMFGYVTALRTITSGRATSSMTYDHHAQVSSSIAKAVLEEVKGRVDLV